MEEMSGKTMPRKRRVLTGVGTIAVSLLMSGCGPLGMGRGDVSVSSSAPPSPAAVSMAGASPAPEASPTGPRDRSDRNFVRSVAAKVEPSVVTVHTMAAIEREPMTLEDMLNGRRGGGGGGGTAVRRGAGSGVIYSADGYILTNNHVVEGAQKVNIEVGGTGYDARVVGADALSDIAVVKIDLPKGTTLTPAQFGDSDTVQVGDWAIAVGNPLDIGATVTLGIVSAIGQRGPHLQGDTASTVLQTDAAINPGNSGGALADSDGKVIGINESILSPTGSFIGIGFAIPINAARKIAEQLIDHKRVIRPYLGISYVPLKSVPPQARAQVGIPESLTDGIVVAQVQPGAPAATAGLRSGDVIIQADGEPLIGQEALNTIIAAHKVGDTVSLQIQRAGKSQAVSVILRERPTTYWAAPQEENR